MRRVLLITYVYPPRGEIGSVRPAGLAKYLPRFGWEPIVLTVKTAGPRPSWAPVIETESIDLLQTWKVRFGLEANRSLHEQLGLPVARKPNSRFVHTTLFGLVKYFLTFPDPAKGWVRFGTEAVQNLAAHSAIDALITTSPPVCTNFIGRRVKALLKCPWIADFRDLWCQNLAHEHKVLRFLEGPIERNTLRRADALVTVSDPWAKRLKKRYPEKLVDCIPNGFDPDEFSLSGTFASDKLLITYTGQLYKGRRNPAPLFAALADLIREGEIARDRVRLRFYGLIEPWLAHLVERYRLQDVVQIREPVLRDQALQLQQGSHVLLLLAWSDPHEKGQHTGKLFEYLGARRPILAVGGTHGVIGELLEETKSGMHPLSHEELKKTLRDFYEEFRTSGFVAYHGDKRLVDRYTHLQMARKFADLMDYLTLRPNSTEVANQSKRPVEA
jgi:hypothetical protein